MVHRQYKIQHYQVSSSTDKDASGQNDKGCFPGKLQMCNFLCQLIASDYESNLCIGDIEVNICSIIELYAGNRKRPNVFFGFTRKTLVSYDYKYL